MDVSGEQQVLTVCVCVSVLCVSACIRACMVCVCVCVLACVQVCVRVYACAFKLTHKHAQMCINSTMVKSAKQTTCHVESLPVNGYKLLIGIHLHHNMCSIHCILRTTTFTLHCSLM